jgi:dienelactone hydrolase
MAATAILFLRIRSLYVPLLRRKTLRAVTSGGVRTLIGKSNDSERAAYTMNPSNDAPTTPRLGSRRLARFCSLLMLGLAATIVAQLAPVSPARATDWMELPAQAGQPKVFLSVVKTSSPGKAPVAIMLHGASGLTRYNLAALEMWAEWLAQRGISSVIVDSYKGRGIRGDDDIQGAKWKTVLLGRVTDAERTLAWLPTQDWADPARAFIFGQSMGGTVGISAAIERGIMLPQVLTYPYCAKFLHDYVNAKPGYPPSLWLQGEEDTIAVMAETKVCAAKIAAAGNPTAVKLVLIPGAKHAFDRSPREITYSGSAIETSKVEMTAFLKARGFMR